MLVVTLNYLTNCKDNVLLISKILITIVLSGLILDILILKTKIQIELHQKIKKLFDEIKQKLINFKFPLEIDENNIKKIEWKIFILCLHLKIIIKVI